MLSFLESIFGKLTELFGSLWGILSWLLKTAIGYLISYVNDLHGSLSDYKWYRMGVLLYYQTFAKDKLDDIGVTNYSKTRYSAVDSFLDLFNYRTYYKSSVDWLSGTAKSPIQTIVLGGFSILYSLITKPKDTINYIINKGFSVLLDYDNNDKKNVKVLSPRTSKVVHITDEPKYGILDTLTGGWYGRIKTYIEELFPSSQSLGDNFTRFLTLVGNLLFGRLNDLGGEKYPKLVDITDKWRHLQ